MGQHACFSARAEGRRPAAQRSAGMAAGPGLE